MYIILGGTGHVGSVVARTLLDQGQPVTIVTHSPDKAGAWEAKGAKVAVADVLDVEALRAVFRTGRRAFLLNPPAAPSTDTDAVETRTVAAIAATLDGSGLEKVVAESTGGAQPGHDLGDLNTLHGLEEALRARDIPSMIIRAGYYFSNWDASLAGARDDGVIHTPFPADFALAMVAPLDLGREAARLLTNDETGLVYVEGPRDYSSADVAAAFEKALGRPVRVETTPRDQWPAMFESLGFSPEAARSYSNMTGIVVDGAYEKPSDPVRGTVALDDYIADLVRRGG